MLVNCLEENLCRKPADVMVSPCSVEVWICFRMDLFFGQGLGTLRILAQSLNWCLGDMMRYDEI